MPKADPVDHDPAAELAAAQNQIATLEQALADLEDQAQHPDLTDAFDVLCRALKAKLPSLTQEAHLLDLQRSYTDGHHATGWRGVIAVLEGVLGVPIRQH